MSVRALALALLLIAGACSPPANRTDDGTSQVQAEDAALAAALTPALAADIGRPVAVVVETRRIEGEWGWVVAKPWTPEGAQIDWSQTRYAQRAAEGVLDGNGTTYALLRRETGQWRVLEFAVGPTDVAWADWAERHGARASLMQTDNK